VAILVLLVVVICAIFAPLVAPHSPNAVDLLAVSQPPSSKHLLGTDTLGRDILSRLIFGSRASLEAALIAVGVAVAAGLPLGIAAGYVKGRTDAVISRIADTVMTIPPLILALAVVAVLGRGLAVSMFTVGVTFTPTVLRVVRASTMQLRKELYIEASVAVGCTNKRIVVVHMLPNLLGPILALVSVMFGNAVIVESSLSFLGLAVQPPTPSWGGMLADASQRLDLTYLIWPPGVAIVLLVAALALVSDGIREAISRRERGNRG